MDDRNQGFQPVDYASMFRVEFRRAAAEEKELVDFLQTKFPQIPRSLLCHMGRKRCECKGRNYDYCPDPQTVGQITALAQTMLPARAKELIEKMYSTPGSTFWKKGDELFTRGRHMAIVYNQNTGTWQNVYVCDCPGAIVPSQIPSGREAAADE